MKISGKLVDNKTVTKKKKKSSLDYLKKSLISVLNVFKRPS